MKKDGRFIPGIYNWCDNWCDRCPQTARCRVFERQKRYESAEQGEDWGKAIQKSFEETLEILQTLAEEKGFKLDSFNGEFEMDLKLQEAKQVLVDQHPLSVWAVRYMEEGEAWLDSGILLEIFGSWQNEGWMNNRAIRAAEDHLNSVEEAVTIIRRYLTLIPIKVNSALQDQVNGFWNSFREEERGDLGSAKIAAICMERSLGAWGVLYKLLPQDEKVLDVLVTLEKLRKGLIEVFPNYSRFIRSGFDDQG